MTATAVAAPAAKLDSPELAGYPQFLRPAVAAPGVYYAGFWVRLGVNVIDNAIQALIYLVVSYVVAAVVGIVAAIAHFDSNAAATPVAVASVLAVYVYYNMVLVARNAASPGMRLCSMRIVRDADISAPEPRTLYVRGALWIAFSITGILRLVDALFIVVDGRKRSLHDRIVGTAVVRKAPSPPKLASLLCTVCGRPVDEGTLCPRHGGSVGLTVTLSGHTVSLQVAASVLALAGVVAVIIGVAVMIGGRLAVGVACVVAGLALVRVTMALTQLRSWARWVGCGVAMALAVGGAAAGVAALLNSNSAGGFLLAGGAVGALVAGCLWTPETYRSFRRVP